MTNYEFFVESMVASRSGKPAVTVTVNGADFTVNMQVSDARALALNLLRAAEAAEGDAFLVSFLRDGLGAGDMTAHVLQQFRDWRER